jgi:hypothetical protein
MYGVSLATSSFALWLQITADQGKVDDAWGFAGMEGLLALAFGTVGFVILRRTSNPAGWIFSVMGIGGALQYLAEEYSSAALAPNADLAGVIYIAWIAEWIWVPLIASAGLLLLVFPDDRIEARSARTIAAIGGVFTVLTLFAAAFLSPTVATFGTRNPFALNHNASLYDGAFSIFATLMMVSLLAAAISLIGRLRRASGIRKQQLKWFAYAAVLASIGNIFGSIPATMKTGSKFAIAGLILMAMAAGRAILRYRLYDIDVIVNRALVYGASTTAIVAIYIAVVFGFQRALAPFTRESDIAIAASTLLVAALFRPLRDRVQRFVDHRFYRSKYNAVSTLAAFGGRLREQIELDALHRDLLDVVGQTVQPAHASLWLKAGSS